nr:PREDICTED: melanoma-associated antigen 1-like [Rhinolophus sinicus]
MIPDFCLGGSSGGKGLELRSVALRDDLADPHPRHRGPQQKPCPVASLWLQLLFGIDVKEVDASNHSYVMVTTLGLSYDGMGSDRCCMPKTSLLVMLLCVIAVEGERAPEERVWEALNDMGVYDGVEHSIYGEPRELITKVLVQEQYVEYRQVANTEPARYEFLWGSRAHAETTKVKALEFLHRHSTTVASSYPSLSEEAENSEEERA